MAEVARPPIITQRTLEVALSGIHQLFRREQLEGFETRCST